MTGQNRLTVLGTSRGVSTFADGDWFNAGKFRHFDLLENSPGHYVCLFESTNDPLPHLRRWSRQRPGLTFLLEYERPWIKGLAKVHAGKISRCEINY